MERKEKDPAAVALGKRRQASMTPEERTALAKAGAEAARPYMAALTPMERRMRTAKGNRTRRLNPPWLRAAAASAVAPGAPAEAVKAEPRAAAGSGIAAELAALAALIDAADDAAIAELETRMREGK